MQVRRPDGGIVPSTASRRFTSDARSQTACAPWMESRFLFHEARPGLPGEFVTAHVCAQTRHPHGHSGHCRSEKHPARLMLSSLPVNLAGFLQPPLECRSSSPIQFSASRPNQRRRAARAEGRRIFHLPSSLGSRRKFGMFQTSHHSFIFQTGCFTQMALE